MTFASVSQFHVYLPWGQCLFTINHSVLVVLKCERRFQPGEGPSRGLLRDCTTSPINRFAALHLVQPQPATSQPTERQQNPIKIELLCQPQLVVQTATLSLLYLYLLWGIEASRDFQVFILGKIHWVLKAADFNSEESWIWIEMVHLFSRRNLIDTCRYNFRYYVLCTTVLLEPGAQLYWNRNVMKQRFYWINYSMEYSGGLILNLSMMYGSSCHWENCRIA